MTPGLKYLPRRSPEGDQRPRCRVSQWVAPDGRVLAATNIILQDDADSFLWHSVERTLDGEEMPDLLPIIVVRVPGMP